jgi:hypothetical protein
MVAFVLQGNVQIIEDIVELQSNENVEFSEPTRANTVGLSLDSTINPEQVKDAVLLVTAIFQSAKAVIDLIKSIQDKLRSNAEEVLMKDPISGKTIIKINKDTTVEQVKSTIEK